MVHPLRTVRRDRPTARARRTVAGSERSSPMATAPKKASSRKAAAKRPTVRRKPLKDPAGGLTAAGRKHFEQTDGAHLRPGVSGKADTPEKKRRKGSFLRRHFANPQGPIEREGEPTRLALSAHAWGEPVPHTAADAKRLAAKGKQLLAEYHDEKDAAAPKPKAKRTAAKKVPKATARRSK